MATNQTHLCSNFMNMTKAYDTYRELIGSLLYTPEGTKGTLD